VAKILIYGAGAIGSLIGYLLSEGADRPLGSVENVALLGRRVHMERVRERGLKVGLPDGTRSIRFEHCFSNLEELIGSEFTPDVVLVTVRTYSLPQLREEITASGALDGGLGRAAFILLMNGMGNREAFDLPVAVYEGITSMGAVFPGPGQVELRGKGITVFEDRMPANLKAAFQERFLEKDFPVEFSSNFKVQQWGKLLVNSVVNPITALTGRCNGVVLSGSLLATVERVVEECVEVAALEGVHMERDAALDLVLSVAETTAENTSSMLKDVQRGRETEIESINGYVVRQGERHGAIVPVNEALFALVKSLHP